MNFNFYTMKPHEIITKFFNYTHNFSNAEYNTSNGRTKMAPTCFLAFTGSMQSHLLSKYWNNCFHTKNGSQSLINIYSFLDDKNKEILINWIMKNY